MRITDRSFCPARRAAVVLAVTSTIVGCSDPAGPDERITESFSLAVTREQPPTSTEIVILRSDGTIESTIPCGGPCNGAVTWSRDRSKLSITATRPGRNVLLVVNRDGTGRTEVASVDTVYVPGRSPGSGYVPYAPDFYEDWSEDGRLVYVRAWARGHAIETVSDDGSGRDTVFTRTSPQSFPYMSLIRRPRWAASDAAISFINDTTLSIIDADGRNLRALSDTVIPRRSRYDDGTTYAWSPDGRMVAFSIYGSFFHRRPSGHDLMVHDVATGITRKIFSAAGLSRSVCGSPNGDRLAFVSSQGNGPEVIATINPDGSGLREEVPDLAPDYDHHRSFGWSPDGTYLVYQTYDIIHTDEVPYGSGRILARNIASGKDIKIGDINIRESFVIETRGCAPLTQGYLFYIYQ